jgi:hypothetical protein
MRGCTDRGGSWSLDVTVEMSNQQASTQRCIVADGARTNLEGTGTVHTDSDSMKRSGEAVVVALDAPRCVAVREAARKRGARWG